MRSEVNKSVNVQFSLPITVLREGEYFVVYTPALDISTSADTFEKAKIRFNDLVKIYFEELIEMGTLSEVLLEQGWQRVNKTWQSPVVVASQNETVNIPMFMLKDVSHNPDTQKKV